MIENKFNEERYLLLSCSDKSEEEINKDLDELEELVIAAGGIPISRCTQRLDKVNPRTYVGSGKIEEIKNVIFHLDITGVVCDDELTPSQMANLSNELDLKVIDRTILILDIFSKRAMTKQGKLQVELAQLMNYYTHMKGNCNLSRLGGGIGTRGPGEKKLELDRRYIRNNINNLRHELKELKKHEKVIRENFNSKGLFKISIVGYTNAGKSTLLNRLANADVLEKDMLFATLDLATRIVTLPIGQKIYLTDTVGFINKLPHNLIESFRSTLEDAKYSDAIIHVIDASDSDCIRKMHFVYEILKELDINKPIITIFNKMDLIDKEITFKDPNADYIIRTSIKNGKVDDVLRAIEDLIKKKLVNISATIKYSDYYIIDLIRNECQLLSIEYRDDEIYFEAMVNEKLFNLIHKIKIRNS